MRTTDCEQIVGLEEEQAAALVVKTGGVWIVLAVLVNGIDWSVRAPSAPVMDQIQEALSNQKGQNSRKPTV